ncbi:MAG: hypothetical protein Q9227_006183 [Pyrenula ochraceoflavens]
MWALRRTAVRALSSTSSLSSLPKARTITSLSPSFLRQPHKPTSITLPRRWASSEAEAKEEPTEDAPVREGEPSQAADLENAMQEDANASTSESPKPSEAATSTTAAEGRTAESTENWNSTDPAVHQPENDSARASPEISHETPSTYQSAAETVREKVSDAVDTVASTVGASSSQFSASTSGTSRFEPKSTIYVGNLFFDVTEADLQKEFGKFGNVIKARLVRDARGLSKGFGYVDYDTVESASAAIEKMHMSIFEGRRLAVAYAAFSSKTFVDRNGDLDKGPMNSPSKTLFIGNMSFEMTDRDLNQLFRSVKNVIDVRVAIDRRTGQPRGFAHADFIDVQSAMNAMEELKVKEVYGRKLRVDFSKQSMK